MRIIAGKHRGRRLQVPKNLPVRPTTDRAREALFSILNQKFDFSTNNILDLYAGTGSISYEFCSRGAASVTAVDQHAGCVRYITQTAKDLDLPLRVYRQNCMQFLEKCKTKYNIIFADPPYATAQQAQQKIVKVVSERELLKPDGLFILEHGEQQDFSAERFFVEQRKYGGCVFSFFDMRT
jgi:16S rRNA (guanine(966)-N(2))-methyltransferase RsmD